MLLFSIIIYAGGHEKKATKTINEPIVYKTRETSEGKTFNTIWTEVQENGLRKIMQDTEDYTETSYGNENTERFISINKKNGDMVEVVVSGNFATIYVTKNAQASAKEINLNKEPFKFPPSFYMKDFVQSDKKSLVIWLSNKVDGELRQMVFTKLNNETVTIDGASYECQKIEMKPTGFAGVFWQAHYWFEINTGNYIKYQGKKGPPGTPDFIIEKVF